MQQPSTFNFGLAYIFFFYSPHTQYAPKNQKTFEIRGQMIKKWIFWFSPSLSAKNASETYHAWAPLKSRQSKTPCWDGKVEV